MLFLQIDSSKERKFFFQNENFTEKMVILEKNFPEQNLQQKKYPVNWSISVLQWQAKKNFPISHHVDDLDDDDDDDENFLQILYIPGKNSRLFSVNETEKKICF